MTIFHDKENNYTSNYGLDSRQGKFMALKILV
jgi:hypothetical protein